MRIELASALRQGWRSDWRVGLTGLVLVGVSTLGLWADDHGHDQDHGGGVPAASSSAPAVPSASAALPAHAGATPVAPAPVPATSPAAVKKSSDQTLSLIREAALALLKEGNARYASGQSRHPNQGADRRQIVVAEGQKPFASILACSDSRSPVEVVFDRGVGDLFVVRVAGNVAGTSELATLEYGIGHLGTPLLVVLGHTGCGAVKAACAGGELHGHLPDLISHIQPAVDRAKAIAQQDADRLVPAAIQANVWHTIEEVILSSDEIRKHLKQGELQVVGGIYDLHSGVVNWLGAHPTQDALVKQGESLGSVAHGAKPSPKAAGTASAAHASAGSVAGAGHGSEPDLNDVSNGGLPKGFKSLLPTALAPVDQDDDDKPGSGHGRPKASGGALEVHARPPAKKPAAAAPAHH